MNIIEFLENVSLLLRIVFAVVHKDVNTCQRWRRKDNTFDRIREERGR
jgi:hypothetical protein